MRYFSCCGVNVQSDLRVVKHLGLFITYISSMFSQPGVKLMASYISINPPEYEADSYVEAFREQSPARSRFSRSALTPMELLISFMFFIDHLISQACPAPPHPRRGQLLLITSADVCRLGMEADLRRLDASQTQRCTTLRAIQA